MAFFNKNKKPSEGGSSATKRNPAKGRAWFERAATVADTRNYDYAIECYIDGLKFDPDNMKEHEALFEVAKRRRVNKGKPASFAERLKSSGKDPVSKMLDAEKIWAKDPLNRDTMLPFMEKAVAADEAESDLNLGEVAYWVGCKLIEANSTHPKPKAEVFIKTRDLFAQIQAYDKAVEACKYALSLSPSNDQLLFDLRNLEAELTLRKANYGGEFRDTVKDMDKQREHEQADEIGRSASATEDLLTKMRADYEENPEDLARLDKLVKVLESQSSDAGDEEAMKLLHEAFDRFGQYRYKLRAGDVQMRQYARQLRMLRNAAQEHPNDAALRKQYNDLLDKAKHFELDEFTERVKNYPTDMRMRFELGRRLYAFQRYDEAIGQLQDAQADPKNRPNALNTLGLCYEAKGWHDEAVETYRRGIEAHPLTDDKLGMELRYHLMKALEGAARRDRSLDKAREAREVGSQILQTNINYRDIRQCVERIRALMDELQKAAP
ncbi:MAG: tetratricopeptide repeat protein [Phycisphaera sp.]|nr:tetratricopeptide repeat protein [Phycisphaera sp.]